MHRIARLSTLLIAVGLLTMTYGVLWELGVVPGSQVSLPEPVALGKVQARSGQAAAGPTQLLPSRSVATGVAPTPIPSELPPVRRLAISQLAVPTAAPVTMVPADAQDRPLATLSPPAVGYAVRLEIPDIGLDTRVEQGGIVTNASGKPEWQTLPFVAVHYGDLTSLIGSRGNAVIAGHVVTLNQGNVFRLLYRLALGTRIRVWDHLEREHNYQVVEIKLVLPSDTSVMAPTPDETLTLITCGGSFDSIRREFSHRLIVVAKPV